MNNNILKFELVVNNKCNFNCEYCCAHMPQNQSSSELDIINIARIASYLNKYLPNEPKYFKIIGGEPLLYPHLEDIYKTIKSCNYTTISLDTNGSIPFSTSFIKTLQDCINNNIEIDVVLSYHKKILENNPPIYSIFLHNLVVLLENIKYPPKIRFLYNKSNKDIIYKLSNEIYNKFDKRIRIEKREIFDSVPLPHDYINNIECYPYRYMGIFPDNTMYYSCFREMYNDKCKKYRCNKENLMFFIKNINKSARIKYCNAFYCSD